MFKQFYLLLITNAPSVVIILLALILPHVITANYYLLTGNHYPNTVILYDSVNITAVCLVLVFALKNHNDKNP